MKNLNYWKQSLENVLENEIVTDDLALKIMRISEMEFEYTESESVKLKTENYNPLDEKVKKLEHDIRVLSDNLSKVLGVDSVEVIGEKVEWFKRD